MMIIHSTLAPETEADLYSIGCYSCCICVGPLQQTDFVAGHTPVLILLYISGTILMVWTRQSPQLQHSMIFWCYDEQKLEWLFYFDAFKVCQGWKRRQDRLFYNIYFNSFVSVSGYGVLSHSMMLWWFVFLSLLFHNVYVPLWSWLVWIYGVFKGINIIKHNNKKCFILLYFVHFKLISSGPESSTLCILRKHMQIIKTQVNNKSKEINTLRKNVAK